MQFKIEQIAIAPRDPARAIELLKKIGAAEWFKDHVVAHGQVFGNKAANEADLAFNYQVGGDNDLEFEVLHYTAGANWIAGLPGVVSHLGMHCTAEELAGWREFFMNEGVGVAQEVFTDSHTNPAIKDSRRYNYVIFDTRAILGVDLKFIVRHNLNAE